MNGHNFPPWNNEIHANYQFYLKSEDFTDTNFDMDQNLLFSKKPLSLIKIRDIPNI